MGRLIPRAAVFWSLLALPACGNPLSPSSLSGSWSGTATLTSCEQVGGDLRSCANILNGSATRRVVLQVTASGGSNFSAVFDYGFGQTVDCNGVVEGDVLRLAGKKVLPDTPSEVNRVHILELSARPNNGDLTLEYSVTIESMVLQGLTGPYSQTTKGRGKLQK